jgi:hypothetical protein
MVWNSSTSAEIILLEACLYRSARWLSISLHNVTGPESIHHKRQAAIELCNVEIPLVAIRELPPQNTEELKQEMTKLWMTIMESSECLKDLVTLYPTGCRK